MENDINIEIELTRRPRSADIVTSHGTVDFENSFPYGYTRIVSRLVSETALVPMWLGRN